MEGRWQAEQSGHHLGLQHYREFGSQSHADGPLQTDQAGLQYGRKDQGGEQGGNFHLRAALKPVDEESGDSGDEDLRHDEQ